MWSCTDQVLIRFVSKVRSRIIDELAFHHAQNNCKEIEYLLYIDDVLITDWNNGKIWIIICQ